MKYLLIFTIGIITFWLLYISFSNNSSYGDIPNELAQKIADKLCNEANKQAGHLIPSRCKVFTTGNPHSTQTTPLEWHVEFVNN